jgi:lysophospholipase L1-like esterase
MSDTRLTIVYMGDSITFGQYLDPRLRWTTLTDARLDARFGDVFESHNRGVSGNTTRMGLERYPEDVQAFRPDVMTLQFGLNDCNYWDTDEGHPRVSEAAFVANLHEMIDRARIFGAREIVLSTNHRTFRREPIASGEPFETGNARYNELTRVVADEAGVTLCDVWEAFVPFDDATLERMLLPAPDVLHLSAEGNAVYADVIWPHLEAAVASALERKGLVHQA